MGSERINKIAAYVREFMAGYTPLMNAIARRDRIARPLDLDVRRASHRWHDAGIPADQAPAWFIAGHTPEQAAHTITAGDPPPEDVARLLTVMAGAIDRQVPDAPSSPPDIPAAELLPIAPERRVEIVAALNGGGETEPAEVVWMGVHGDQIMARLADGTDLIRTQGIGWH